MEIKNEIPFIWESEVRSYELDAQQIVNNACYLNYFDHCRVKHLQSRGVNWIDWHNDGFNIVLINVNLTIKSPLLKNDLFYVTSKIARDGKLKIMFHQEIIRAIDKRTIASAINTVVCLEMDRSKPVMPKSLETKLFDKIA